MLHRRSIQERLLMLYGLGVIKRCVLLVVLILSSAITNSWGALEGEDKAIQTLIDYCKSNQAVGKILAAMAMNNKNALRDKSFINDPFIQKFVKDWQNDNIKYQNGRLFLCADPAYDWIVLKALCVIACGIVSVCCLMVSLTQCRHDSRKNFDDDLDNRNMGLMGLFVFGYLFIKMISKLQADSYWKRYYVPYITFDAHGLSLCNERVLYWKDVHFVNYCPSVTYDYEGGSVTKLHTADVKRVMLRDELGQILFSLPVNDRFLPISIDQFYKLVKYYAIMYGKVKCTVPSKI
jgi:hypothetical protein